MIKILTIVGARPQFIKAAGLSREIKDNYGDLFKEIIVHTGQHYDSNMSKVFFDDLNIPEPKYSLGISDGGHGDMTGRMLIEIEKVMIREMPDRVLVYGDTNSTLAGALAAAKLQIPVAHVESGLRSFNKQMPEEINRVLTDRVSSLLFCPTISAVTNLNKEGVSEGVFNVGDIMYDVALFYQDLARKKSTVIEELGVFEKGFALATCHRAENTNDPDRLREILSALSSLSNELPVVFPIHPRTRKLIKEYKLSQYLTSISTIEPLPFLDMIALEQSAKLILTDSGGVQKEAFFYHVPCITIRDETEWVETVELGANRLCGASKEKIMHAISDIPDVLGNYQSFPYGDGKTARKIAEILSQNN